MEEKVKKINEDELLVTLTTDELASLSEATEYQKGSERLTIRSQVKNKRISPKFNNKKVHNK